MFLINTVVLLIINIVFRIIDICLENFQLYSWPMTHAASAIHIFFFRSKFMINWNH